MMESEDDTGHGLLRPTFPDCGIRRLISPANLVAGCRLTSCLYESAFF